jgi:hypothetical protein
MLVGVGLGVGVGVWVSNAVVFGLNRLVELAVAFTVVLPL